SQPEYAKLGQLLDHLEWNVFIFEMPLVGMRINFIETEAAHQVLDLDVRLIEPGVAERHRARLRCDQLAEPRFDRLRATFGDQIGNRILESSLNRLPNTERLGTNDLDLAHRNA